ncbi:MAG: CoA-substrate-specific enzyme activase, partial [Firmicutes bacterium]|nr:CoA-substrate-specific enzyme activase [Bacillota bacterium]
MENAFRVGVDVGSTTIKIVILDERNSIVFQQYFRHFSNIISTLKTMIDTAHATMPKKLLSVMFTGSAGIGLSKCMDISFVQEVVACTQAVR